MKLLLHTNVIMSFILGVTALGMLVHLVRLQQPVKAKNWLTAYYLGLLIWQIEKIIRYSLPLEYIGTTPYKVQTIFLLIPALAVTLISYSQYTYRFLIATFSRERKIVLRVSLFLTLCELLFVAWNELYNGSNLAVMMTSGFLYGSLFTVWVIILAFRKAMYLRTIDQRASKAHFIYTGINACYVGGSVCSLFFGLYSTPGFWSYFLLLWFGNLASIVLFIVTAAVPANFQVKVTGFTYVMAATVLIIITLTFYPPVILTNMPARLAQQNGLVKMMVIIIVITALIVTLMPFMLKVSLTAPLQRLLTGVQEVNAGKLDTQVAVGLPDEIGLLTQNFNQMTRNLKKAQDDLTEYAQTLENKVAKRTAQLQKSLNDLRAAQTQLIQSEKMASLGELTAGIAHEIQNPLNFVNNFSEVNKELIAELKEEIDKGHVEEVKSIANGLEENEQKIAYHGKRAEAIVKGMLEHSRASTGKKEFTNINALADEYLRLSYQAMRSKDKSFTAVLETHFDNSIEKINVVPQDMGRVLLNLFNNAFYTVNEKKKHTNGTFEPTVSIGTKKVNDKVEIIVKDNGSGISQSIKDKIFQPFFTTKPSGQGTGLGLSLSYDIIKAHGGEIKVESKDGEGSEFIVCLPV